MNNIIKDDNGNYIWDYKLDLNKNKNIFILVMKILTLIFVFIVVAVSCIALFNHSFSWDSFIFFIKICIPSFLLVYLIGFISYWIYSKKLKGEYNVTFVMNEKGIKHIPHEREREYMEDVGKASMLIGGMTNNLGTAGSGLYMATLQEVYSDFNKVVIIKTDRKHDLINVNYLTLNNQVYATKDDYDFVLDYIVNHCPNAKVIDKH